MWEQNWTYLCCSYDPNDLNYSSRKLQLRSHPGRTCDKRKGRSDEATRMQEGKCYHLTTWSQNHRPCGPDRQNTWVSYTEQ